MEFISCEYIVERIDGDYAMLKNLQNPDHELKQAARALLPPEIREGTKLMYEMVIIHGALHLAARHPASKIAIAGIRPLAVRRFFNGLDALQFAVGQAVNCNMKCVTIHSLTE